MLQLGNKITLGEPIYRFENNHSVDFDGVDDFIQLGEPISYTQHTISTWVKVSDSDASKTIIDARDSADDGIRIFLTSAEVVTYQINTSDITSGSAISVDEWHHIVGTYDGTTQKLYIDGSLVSSATTSQTISTTTNAEIGSRNFSDRANEFLGKIDELAIWDRALTADEVTAIFRIKYGANLVQNGNFDELGSELVTNGDFSNGLTGFVTENVELAEGGVRIQSDGSSGSFIKQSGILTLNKTYKLVFDVTQVQQTGSLRVGFSSLGVSNITTTGTYTIYFVANGSEFQFVRNSAINVIVDNVSVKQVDPNDRWNDIDDKFTFVNNGGKLTGNSSGLARLYAINPSALTSAGKTYKVSYTVVENNSSVLQHYDGDSYETITSTVGDHSFIYTRQGSNNNFILRNASGDSASIILSNIMLQEQKYVATNLKLNSGNYKSADPVIVSTKSIEFDGTDDYLDAGDVGNVKTLSFWFNTDSDITDSSSRQQLFGFNGTTYFGIRLGVATGFLTGEVLTVLPNDGSRTATTHTFEAGRWYHVAIVWNSSQNYYDIFINGVARTDLNTGTGVNDNFESFIIGADNETANFFDGQIDEVGIFNAALTSDQVIELYNQGVPGNLSTHSANANLTGYWKMGDGTLDEAPLIADQTNATLGSEIMTDGNFSEGLTHYTTNNVEVSNGVVSFDSTSDWIFQNHGSSFTTGKIYKVSTEGTGNLRFRYGFANTAGTPQAFTVGTNLYFVADSDTNRIQFFGSTPSSAATLSNISVKQVNGNPALMENTPTIVTDAPLTKIRNYYRMGDGLLDKHQADNNSTGITLFSTRGLICDMVQPSLGTELITDGDFPSGTSAWTLGTGWSLEAGACVRSGASSNTDFRQSISITANKIYQISYTRIYVSGTRTTNLFSDFETDGTSITLGDYRGTEETFTVVSFFMPTYTGTVPIRVFGINDWTGKITNVSVKEVNGVGGLMTNMLNTDITNDVPS